MFLFLVKNKDTVVFSFQANIYAIVLCKLLNITIIARSNSSPEGWYHNWFKKFLYSRIISLADTVIVNSKEFKIQMEKKFGINPKCIFNPLNKKEIFIKSKIKIKNSPFKKKNELKILNIGRFTEQKDQITIIKAAKILENKNFKFKIAIMGRGVEKENLLKAITAKQLNEKVELIPFQKNPYPFIKKCDLFVLSSKYEGLPNVLLEAATLNKSIISTKCPTGPQEILMNGKAGTLFKIGDYKDLAKKIIFLKKNKLKSQKMRKINYYNLYRFDYHINLEEYYKTIKTYL